MCSLTLFINPVVMIFGREIFFSILDFSLSVEEFTVNFTNHVKMITDVVLIDVNVENTNLDKNHVLL